MSGEHEVDKKDIVVSNQTDDEIIEDAKKYLEASTRTNSTNFEEARKDLEMLVGNHWPEAQRRAREIDGRPCLTVNKLPTFVNQVTNDQRQNRISIKVSPVGDGTDMDDAETLQGIIRHIEYASNAEVATDTAVTSAATVGFGYYRFVTDYCDEKSFDQEIRYQRIANQFSVAFDQFSTEPDGSDQTRCLIHTKMDPAGFKLEYPNATATTQALTNTNSGNVNWLGSEFVRVGEFYRVERAPAELVRMSDGGVMWADEVPKSLPDGIYEVARRKSFKKKVMLYKLTAVEILERTEIKCPWIPVFPVYGMEVNMDGKIVRSGLIRNARDPQMMYDFWMTSATEEVALRPKTPYIGAEGQFEGYEEQWQQANVRSFATLEYRPVTLEGMLAPPPQRQPMADIPNGMLTMAMHANDNIKSTTGLFDSSLGAAGNATSGRQELAQQKQGNITNFHYSDNLKRTRQHDARCLVAMIPHYYDTERVVNIMRDDGEIKPVTINKRLTSEEQAQEQMERQRRMPEGSKRAASVKRVLNDVVNTKFAVVVSTGPSYNTMRKEAADAMVQFGQSWPKLMDIAGDKVVKAMDWPGAEEIAERIERTIPPEIRYDPDDPEAGPPPVPPQIKAQMEEMIAKLEELSQENSELRAGVDKEMIKAKAAVDAANIRHDATVLAAEIAAEARKDVEELKGMVAILLAKLQPPEGMEEEVRSDMAQDDRIIQPGVSPQSSV